MTSLGKYRPGLRYGPAPVRSEISDHRIWLDRLFADCITCRTKARYSIDKASVWLDRLTLNVQSLSSLSVAQRQARLADLKQQLRLGKSYENTLDNALAYTCVAAEEVLHLCPRANQRLAAHAMLDGNCVEMATGEGKTLSIAMAASVVALSGTPVHVLTANEYLAARDASAMAPMYRSLGLKVASITAEHEPEDRRQAYKADVVYVTAKQVAFDWLSDVQQSGTEPDSLITQLSVLTQSTPQKVYQPLLRGLCVAIVDEADSLLVDEARIPLVLAVSPSADKSEADTETTIALALAERLREGIDFNVSTAEGLVRLSGPGRAELKRIATSVAHLWQSSRYREERVQQALTALHLIERDRDYIVRDGQLELLDVHTGRALPDRRLPHGLHRFVEVKEKCVPAPQQEIVASMPFQHFFKRYLGLAGVSGTLCEVASEIQHVYGLCVAGVAPHRPNRRVDLPAIVFSDRSAQLKFLVSDVRQRQKLGQPTLVCTRSVEQSLGVSAMFRATGIAHQVLNAYQDADEASIVATAGQPGQVTVATNMAGRGTDIPLGDGVDKLGGLHVVSLAFNDARRLDRQLAGRAARQGDPGSYQHCPSLDDPYLIKAMPEWIQKLANGIAAAGWHRASIVLVQLAQRRLERKHRQERLLLYKTRDRLEQHLAFGGEPSQLSR